MSSSTLRIGTRDSVLARLQTDIAIKVIAEKFPEIKFEILAVKTSGDKILNVPLSQLGGRGVFVKELEESLLRKEVDIVVHSLKDLPTEMPDELVLAATIERADPRDVLLSKSGKNFAELPPQSRVATSSLRRAAQLSALRNDVQFVDIRGNLQTRLRKLDEGQCDAMVLAAAGLQRLSLGDRIAQYFEPEHCTPAVGQGALGIECHQDNQLALHVLAAINDKIVWACATAERAFLNRLGGGCSVPVGALAKLEADGQLNLSACVASLDGKQIVTGKKIGTADDAASIGNKLADELLEKGAGKIVEVLLKAGPGSVSPP